MYKIYEIQDLSRPRCKRYLAHIEVDAIERQSIKQIIERSTQEVREKCNPAHVVWLYVWHNRKLLCRTMWEDKTLEDVPMPRALDSNDCIGDIDIMWV